MQAQAAPDLEPHQLLLISLIAVLGTLFFYLFLNFIQALCGGLVAGVLGYSIILSRLEVDEKEMSILAGFGATSGTAAMQNTGVPKRIHAFAKISPKEEKFPDKRHGQLISSSPLRQYLDFPSILPAIPTERVSI